MLDLMLSGTEHHDHSNSGGMLDTLIRGLFWRTGTDAANSLFAAAPSLVTGVVVVIALGAGLRWLIRR
jgi:hypothetical protein